MNKSSERFQLPEHVQRLILSKKCVVFIGSGPSIGSYDAWPDLVNRLCRECGCGSQVTADSSPDDLLDVAEEAKCSNEERYYEVLGEHFGGDPRNSPIIYDALFQLPFESYLTPNFDPLLSLRARTLPRECKVHAYPNLDRKWMTGNIHYLHGMIPEEEVPLRGTIVLARSDFNEAYGPDSNLMSFLIPTLANEHILFIGCRLDEPVMKRVFSICKMHQQRRLELMMQSGIEGTPPTRVILLAQHTVEPHSTGDPQAEIEAIRAEDKYYKGLDIEVVRYPARGRDHSALRRALESIAKLPSLTPSYGWGGGDSYAK